MTHATRLLALLTLGLLSLPCPGEILSPDIARPQLDGLMVPLPNVGARALLAQLHEQRSSLECERAIHSQAVERNRMTVGKTLLLIVAPGGLLIAAGMQAAKADAEQQVAALDQRIDNLNRDLLAMQRIATERSLLLAGNDHTAY